MRRLDGQDVRNAYEVARRFNELAEEVGAKLDHLFARMDSIERVGADKSELFDWIDEGDPGECTECGAPYQIVRPGKTQSSCRCDEVRQLTEDCAELRCRLDEKPVGLLDEIEILRGEITAYEKRRVERKAECERQRVENERLRAELERASLGCERVHREHEALPDCNERLSARIAVLYGALNECQDFLVNRGRGAWRESLLDTVKDALKDNGEEGKGAIE